jgi:hypothetical protein
LLRKQNKQVPTPLEALGAAADGVDLRPPVLYFLTCVIFFISADLIYFDNPPGIKEIRNLNAIEW